MGGRNHCFKPAFHPDNSLGSCGAHFQSVFLLLFGGFAWKFGLAMPCEASSQTVFFIWESNEIRHWMILQSCRGPLSMWRCRSGGAGGASGGTCGADRGPETGACRADQWFESSRWGEFFKRSKSPISRQKHEIWWSNFMLLPLEVSLRDDPSTHGICKEFADTQLCLSSGAFGNFGTEAQIFIEKEDVSVHREQRLEEQRIRKLVNKAGWAICGPFLKWNSWFWGEKRWCCWWFASLFRRAPPWLLCFTSQRAAPADRCEAVSGANAVIRGLRPEAKMPTLWWRWCMPSEASHGLPLCCGSLCCWGWLSFLGLLQTLMRSRKRLLLISGDRTIVFEGNVVPLKNDGAVPQIK